MDSLRLKFNSVGSLVIVLGISLFASAAHSLGGTSGSKLVTPCTDTVPPGKIELEPYLSVGSVSHGYDGDFSRYDLGLRHRTVESGFRYTVGLLDNLELGLITPIVFARMMVDDAPDIAAAGLGDIPLGLKWRFWESEPAELALQVGTLVPSGYSNGDDEQGVLALGDGSTVPEIGLVSTVMPVDALTIDVSLTGGVAFPTTRDGDPTWVAALDLALGYAIGPFQPVVEVNQALGGWGGLDDYVLSTNLGFTYELKGPVIVVTGVGIDLVGKSVDQGWSYNLAFTILL